MKRRTLSGLLACAVLASSLVGALAEVKDNPYQVIVNRNAFALKPPPPPTPPTPAEPPPSPVEVFLTGISTLGGTKKVLLQITDKSPSKGGKTEFPPPLVEGDVQGRIKVVSIDPEKGAVAIKSAGNEKTLTFEKDAPKSAAPAPPGAPPPGGVHPPGAIPVPQPGIPSPIGTAAVDPASRYGVAVGGAAPSVPAPAAPVTSAGASSVGASASAIPSRPLRTTMDAGGNVVVGGGGGTTPATTAATAAPVPTMTRDQAIAHINEQRQLYEDAYKAGLIQKRQNLAPILPPPPGYRQPTPPSPTQTQ